MIFLKEIQLLNQELELIELLITFKVFFKNVISLLFYDVDFFKQLKYIREYVWYVLRGFCVFIRVHIYICYLGHRLGVV